VSQARPKSASLSAYQQLRRSEANNAEDFYNLARDELSYILERN